MYGRALRGGKESRARIAVAEARIAATGDTDAQEAEHGPVNAYNSVLRSSIDFASDCPSLSLGSEEFVKIGRSKLPLCKIRPR